MRRTDQEFKEEILRREKEYRAHQKQRRKKVLGAAICLTLVFFGSAMILPLRFGLAGGAGNMAQMPEAEGSIYETPAEAPDASQKAPGAMVMIEDVLYLDAGSVTKLEHTSDIYAGWITSSVFDDQIPMVNDQSNFGTGFGYRFGSKEGTVEINIDGIWRIFEALH